MRYYRFVLTALVVLIAGMVSIGLAYGQAVATTETTAEKKETAPVDPSGTWKWEVEIGGNTAEFKLKLNWDGKKLTGKYTAFDNTTDIEVAKLEKDQLSFVDKREFNGNEIVAEFKGKVKPDDIDGTVTVEFGDNGPQDFDWTPKRAVEIDDVVGKWELSLEGPNGAIEPQLTLTKDGEKLSGKYVSPFGERVPKSVTLKDNKLIWDVSGERDGAQFKVVYTGIPRGNTIEGDAEFDFDGNTGSMEFTGKRTPPEEKEKVAAEAKPVTEAAPAKPADAGEN